MRGRVVRHILLWMARNRWLKEHLPRLPFARRAVRRFMPGEAVDEALAAAEPFRVHGIGMLFTRLGENLADLGEAQEVAGHYHGLLDRIAAFDEHAAVAFRKRNEVDAAYQSLAVLMLPQAAAGELRLGLGTHDLELVDRIAEYAATAGFPKTCFEVQMLYGIRARDQVRLAESGYRVRDLVSYCEAL